MNKIGIITDDMTGTMTCGVLLAKAGITACSYFSKDNLSGAEEHEAVILSANSRSLGKDEAKASVKAAYQALIKHGVKYFTKRIDTTFRGGIGYEVDALLEELPSDTIAVMAAAMPDTKRIVVGGYSIIDGVVLTETGVVNDVLTPVTQAHIPTLIRQQSNYNVGEITLNIVLAEDEKLRSALKKCRAEGSRIIVIDAVTTEHLSKIARAVHDLKWNVVAVDPGAFTQQLALCRGFGHKENITEGLKCMVDIEACTGKIIVVAGSTTDVTRQQLKRLSAEEYVINIPIQAENLIEGKDKTAKEIESAVQRGCSYLNDDKYKVLIIETAATSGKLQLKEKENEYRLTTGQGSKNINYALGSIVYEIAFNSKNKGKIAGFYMTGGDTLVTVLKALGAAGIRLIDTVQPQVNLGTIIGGVFEGTKIVGKGGLIGKEDTAFKVANRLFYEIKKQLDLGE